MSKFEDTSKSFWLALWSWKVIYQNIKDNGKFGKGKIKEQIANRKQNKLANVF